MRTLEEKVAYNKKREKESSFASGYVFGVDVYISGNDLNLRPTVKETVNTIKVAAKKDGGAWQKGFLCGYRDAANDRKAKKK